MTNNDRSEITMEELEVQEASELPRRELLATVSLLGMPVLGISDVAINLDVSGPGWLISG
jgi:hypothetical protein